MRDRHERLDELPRRDALLRRLPRGSCIAENILRHPSRLDLQTQGRLARPQPVDVSPAAQRREISAINSTRFVSVQLRIVRCVGARGEELVDQVAVVRPHRADKLRRSTTALHALAVAERRRATEVESMPQARVSDSQRHCPVVRVTVRARAIRRIVRIEIIHVAAARAPRDGPWPRIASVFQTKRGREKGAAVAVRRGRLALGITVRVSPSRTESRPDAQRSKPQTFANFCRHIFHRLDPLARRHHADQLGPIGLRSYPLRTEHRVGHRAHRRNDR